jgi:hypothetical protein
MKEKFLSLIFGCSLGFFVWICSPFFTYTIEPWDSASRYYPIALFSSGVIGTLIFSNKYLNIVAGIIFGQIIFIVIFRQGPLVQVGVFLIIVYAFMAFIGAWLTKQFLSRNN